MKERVVKLTDLPISKEMNFILARLRQGESVSIEEIYGTDEMLQARTHVNYSIQTIFIKNREEEQQKIFREYWELGAVTIKQEDNIKYDERIAQKRYLDIVIGLPNANKYGPIINEISRKCRSRIIDTEQVKREIIEYNNGWGSAVVHEEARYIADMVFEKALIEYQNIVLSKVGDNAYTILEKYIAKAKQQGYIVNVHYIDLSREEALLRSLNEYIDTGVLLLPDLIERFVPQDKVSHIEQTYVQLTASEMVDGYTKWKDSALYGDAPCLLVQHGTACEWTEGIESVE